MEKWNEVYTPQQLKKVQELELNNLKVLTDICEKIGVDFFAYGGTLIGAVRHKGFIPWDDDLDIAMTRDNYIKFIAEAPKYLNENYYLQTPYTDKKTPYYYSKLRLKNTKYVEYGYSKLKIEQGLYVDIYPIDSLPNDEKLFYKQYKKFQKYVKLFVYRQCPYLNDNSKNFKTKIKRFVKYTLSLFLKVIPRKYLINKIDKISTKYNGVQTNLYGNYSFPKPTNVFRKIYPLIDGELDGNIIKLPNDYDYHLKSRYGNYMKLPPPDKRIGHIPYNLDLGNY